MKPDFKTWLENKYTPKGGMTIGKLPSVIFTEPKPRILRDINEFASDFAEQEMIEFAELIGKNAEFESGNVWIYFNDDLTKQYLTLAEIYNQKFKEDES
jgi:hypothetical protein